MNTIFLYIIKLFLKNIFIASLLIIMMLFLSAAYGAIGSLSGYDYSIIQFMIFTFYAALLDINKVIPISIALSVMMTILMLMRSNEMLAYITIGGSIVKLSIPFLIIGISISMVMIVMEYNVVPVAKTKKEVWRGIVKGYKTNNIVTGFNNAWFAGHDEVITNIGFVSITDKKVYNVTEYFLDNNSVKNIVKIDVIYKKEDKNEWIADNITVSNVSVNPPTITHIASRVLKEGTSIWDQIVSLSTTNIKELTPRELYTMIQISRSKGINSSTYEISLYYKIASALSVIVLVIFLFPISIDFSRNYSIVKNATITFSFALVFIISQTIGKALGDKGALSPITATFGPLILFLILSIFLIYSRSRAR